MIFEDEAEARDEAAQAALEREWAEADARAEWREQERINAEEAAA